MPKEMHYIYLTVKQLIKELDSFRTLKTALSFW